MIIHKCDKCGKTADGKKGDRNNTPPKGWYTLRHGQYSNGVQYHICNDCRASLGIPEDYGKAETHVGDQLIELIEEIVQEAVENQEPNIT